MLTGLGLLFGNLGALGAQVPLRLAIENFGWRAVVLGSAAAILLVCALAWALVRNDPSDHGFASYAPPALQRRDKTSISAILSGFRHVFQYRNTWLIFVAQGGFVGPILAFTGLWGAPYLKARYALATRDAAAVCSVMIVCWAVASPIAGALSDRIGRRKPIYWLGSAITAAGWLTMFYLPGLPLAGFVAVAAITSLASGAVVLGFAYAKESVPVQFLGTISGATNIGNMIGPTLLQPGIGRVLDQQWAGQMAAGVRVYSVEHFQAAFLLIAAWSVASFLLIAFTRETHCRPNA
jgi:nitrate/nitrite transporter NarK